MKRQRREEWMKKSAARRLSRRCAADMGSFWIEPGF